MTDEVHSALTLSEALAPFPGDGGAGTKTNAAVRIYGNRLYKDQTPVEYLAEFLLVFVSPKSEAGESEFAFRLSTDDTDSRGYWPVDRIALKLFAFFPSSKLETRHPVHRRAYLAAIESIKSAIHAQPEKKEETIRLIQSLFSGFVGVAKNRTWATYSFLPASTTLLARELGWLHSAAQRDKSLNGWSDAKKHFAHDRHMFMARGGEVLFLQLANLFSDPGAPELSALRQRPEYAHLDEISIQDLERQVSQGLRTILDDAIRPLNGLVSLIEDRLSEYRIEDQPKIAPLGWVPAISRTEALLFASEINNICSLRLSSLERLDLLQVLCCFQVLRSLCFQAARIDGSHNRTPGFAGHYAWVACDPAAQTGTGARQMAQTAFTQIEGLLYRVLRREDIAAEGQIGSIKEADKNGFQIFRKIAKEIGLVIPIKGGGERFVLPPELLRFLVAALVRPGEHVRLTEFYSRVFAHYGIALGGEPLSTALDWSGGGSGDKRYGIDVSTAWVEETLQQGGFLIELSDAVSIVHSPGGTEVRA